ncbi:MAG: aromatic amino acid ammonia-lyase, partial [Flavobacteriaceae bacterium]|nr:aromatic amino acid ammonia-lyase [Flavobacteriaceae bacterium]
EDQSIRLSESAIQRIQQCHRYLSQKIKSSDQPIYGINTGFGALCNIKISGEKLEQLQYNLVVSHACGIGSEVPQAIVKLMLLLKIKSLSYGYSGVHLDTVQRLVDLYNHDILPVVFTQGSLGASGDLAPLAHLSLPLLGLGEVYYKGEKQSVAKVYEEFGWKPIVLGPKEGLALLNGTQFMSAYGVYNLFEAHRLSYFSDVIAALAIDAFDCNLFPFDADIHQIRPHQGQLKTAERIREFLAGSELAKETKVNVQDPYSFRCVPQVHGAIKDTIEFVTQTFETEINAVTDNPNIFIATDKILSGGNFHGQALAMTLDYLAIALSELANISERRSFQLVSGNRNLPAFLTYEPGLNSGFMIPQYTAASIVS